MKESLTASRLDDKERILKDEITKIYGEMPPRPTHLSYKINYADSDFAAGKALLTEYTLLPDFDGRESVMTVVSVIPKARKNPPVIVILTECDGIPNKFLPAEEIVEKGYAIWVVKASSISQNNGDFKNGLCSYVAKGRKKKYSPGKITVWAWAMMRAVSLLEHLDITNNRGLILAGHGIYARAALLAAGLDSRVHFVIANGINGIPHFYSDKRPKSLITVRDFPYHYCPSFVDNPFGDELDFLLSLCRKKIIMIGAATGEPLREGDREYDYLNSFCKEYSVHCSPIINESKENSPTVPVIAEGEQIACHIRCGQDYFSREDWNIYLNFIDKKL